MSTRTRRVHNGGDRKGGSSAGSAAGSSASLRDLPKSRRRPTGGSADPTQTPGADERLPERRLQPPELTPGPLDTEDEYRSDGGPSTEDSQTIAASAPSSAQVQPTTNQQGWIVIGDVFNINYNDMQSGK